MSSTDTLNAAVAAGIRVTVEGESILLEAASAPPEELLDALRRDKIEILALLRVSSGPWATTEADEATEEPAAIMKEAGTNPVTAEHLAELAREFYSHFFAKAKRIGCCFAPAGRYCNEGERLKEDYYTAAAGG